MALLNRIFKIRSSSYPYISGDGFRNIAHHIYDETNTKMNTSKVKEKDIVFVNADMLIPFFENIHRYIQNKYILISHNSDRNIDESYIKYIDEKIIHYFAQNVMIENSKITPIPIGLENKHIGNINKIKILNKYRKDKNTNNNKILASFNVKNNITERQKCLDSIIKNENLNDLLDIKMNFIEYEEYIKNLKKYNFIISPPGNGLDCHRTWEALYMGVIPIVEDSIMTRYFQKNNIPLQIVNNWSNFNVDNKKFTDSEALYLPFWINKIKTIQ